MAETLRAPRTASATQTDWDRFATAIEVRLRALEAPLRLGLVEGLGRSSPLSIPLDSLLCVAPTKGQELVMLLPSVTSADDGRLCGVLRLSSEGTVSIFPAGSNAVCGLDSGELLASLGVTLLVARQGSWYQVFGGIAS